VFGRSIRVARIAGIPVGVSPWWLVIVAFLTWSLGSGYFAQRVPELAPVAALALALASVLTIFAGILAHEFAHALVARRAGVEIVEVDLWLLGGVARMRNQPRRAVDELRFALAGPAVTAVIALAFGLIAWWLSPAAPAGLRAFVDYQLQVNAAIVVFNLLPALPLDGGRAARAILWRRTGDLRRATRIAADAGRGIGYALAWLGLLAVLAGYVVGVWAAVIGLFIVGAAASERHHVELSEALDGATAEDLMSAPPVALPGVDGRGGGDPHPPALLRAEDPAAGLLEDPDFTSVGRAVVVDGAGRAVGVISVADMERRLQTQMSVKPRKRPARAGR
jgi:Zn-dependent protease